MSKRLCFKYESVHSGNGGEESSGSSSQGAGTSVAHGMGVVVGSTDDDGIGAIVGGLGGGQGPEHPSLGAATVSDQGLDAELLSVVLPVVPETIVVLDVRIGGFGLDVSVLGGLEFLHGGGGVDLNTLWVPVRVIRDVVSGDHPTLAYFSISCSLCHIFF